MTRGKSPPTHHDWHGEGAGHEVKKHKGSGYARSSHHEGLAGPRDGGRGGGSAKIAHTGYHTTEEKKHYGSAHKLPGEHHIPFRKGMEKGDNFEQEIHEHFPSKHGIANINKTSMPKENSPIPHSGPVNEKAVMIPPGNGSGKAEHHPRMQGIGHKFNQPLAAHAHGYGHGEHQKHGFMRTSGHPHAHRIGDGGHKTRNGRCK